MMFDTLFPNLAINLSISSEVDEIFRPLKEHFGVSSLVYAKNYLDGSEVRLSNQPAWIKHYYKNELYLNSGFEQHPKSIQSGFAVWAHLTHHQRVLSAARDFNIDHGMTLIQKTADGCEFYFIGTTYDKSHVTNLLLNNLDLLHQFTFYFKEQAEPLLKIANQNRIIVPNKFNRILTEEQGLPQKKSSLKDVFTFKKLFLSPKLYLTARETDCAKLLAQGYSARLIGEILSLSPRTIETHIHHLKQKLDCSSKIALICKLKELNIHLN